MTSVPHSGAKSVTHTPGKWMAAAKPSSIVGWPVVAAPMGQVICDVAIINKKPDHISDGEFSAYYAQVEANARLIAAAPELLEALDRCSAALQRLHTDIEALTADSEGVVGLHHNGDVAPWSELLEGGQYSDWLGDHLWAARNAYHDARAAIGKATAGETRNAEGAL